MRRADVAGQRHRCGPAALADVRDERQPGRDAAGQPIAAPPSPVRAPSATTSASNAAEPVEDAVRMFGCGHQEWRPTRHRQGRGQHGADREVDPEDRVPRADGEDERAEQRPDDTAELLDRADDSERQPTALDRPRCRRPAPASPVRARRRRRLGGIGRSPSTSGRTRLPSPATRSRRPRAIRRARAPGREGRRSDPSAAASRCSRAGSRTRSARRAATRRR